MVENLVIDRIVKVYMFNVKGEYEELPFDFENNSIDISREIRSDGKKKERNIWI